MKRVARAVAALLVVMCWPLLALPGGVLLRNDFIESIRNRVTVRIDFTVDAVKPRPNTIGDSSHDGDLHFAGRSDQIGLPMIAELSNGRLTAVRHVEQQIHQAVGTNTAVHMRGVWRLWMEHKSSQP